MKKKLGISILIGVIIFSCVLGVFGIVYTTINNVYAAEKRSDFSFAIDTATGKPKTYKFSLEEDYGFNMILPNGVQKKDVTFRESNNAGLIEVIKGDDGAYGVRGAKLGKGTLIASIKIGNKTYEASTTFEVVERDFSFPIVDKAIKKYTGNDALTVGKEYTFKMRLPKGFNQNDVEFSETSGLLNIDNNSLKITPKKAGKGVLKAHIKSTNYYTEVEFEVVSPENTNKNNNTSNSNNNTNNSNSVRNVSVKFKEKTRIVTFNGKSQKIYEGPITSGVKSGNLEWSSSDTSIASVEGNTKANNAVVTLKKPGVVTITAKHPETGASDSKQIIIYSQDLSIFNNDSGKEITDTTLTLQSGDSLKIMVKDGNNSIENSKIKFTTSNGKVCTVDDQGNIKAVSKGTVTIKAMLSDNNKSRGQFVVKVSGSQEEKMQEGNFSFPIDPETKKVKEYKGKYAFVIENKEGYGFNMIVPEGAENYPITYSCSPKDLLQINDNGVTALKEGTGVLTAKIQIGGKTKTATTKFEVFATNSEKEKAGGTEIPYINISFAKESMVIQKGNSVTLKPNIDTNILKKNYELVWTSTNDQIVSVNQNGKITALSAGTADIVLTVKGMQDVKATMKVDVQEKVILVSSLKLETNLTKKSSTYLLKTNHAYNMEFSVLPANASQTDYSIEVEDKENFVVNGKTVIAINPGIKTKLIARALDSGNKSITLNIETVMSDSEIESLSPILDQEKRGITLNVGETIRFKNVENLNKKPVISKSNSNISLDYDESVVSISGKKLGSTNITITYLGNKVVIPVKVVPVVQEATMDDEEVKVSKLAFPTDIKTGETKNYVQDYPFVVGTYYKVADSIEVLPTNATNKNLNVTVSDNKSFTVTPDGSVMANVPNKTATLTVQSVSNPSVKKSIRIASTDSQIASIKFAKDYVNGVAPLKADQAYGFNFIITLKNGHTYDPVSDPNVVNNEEYKRLNNQITVVSNDESLVKIINNGANVVKGRNGSGTLTAYVSYDESISTTCKFDSIGIDENVKIQNVKFAKNSYDIKISEGQKRFLPIINLSDGNTLDPSKDYDDPNGVATTAEYQNYLSQLELKKIDKESNGILPTGRLVLLVDDGNNLIINPKYGGKCELGISFKGSENVMATTTLNVIDDLNESSNNNKSNNVTAEIEEINHATTTTNKNLRITKIEFVDRSYTLTGNYGYAFRPKITLSDGTEMTKDSKDIDVYKYYLDMTEFYLTNDSSMSTVDFGVVEILNHEPLTNDSPKALVPLKNGKVILAVGFNGITYDSVPVTVNLK